MASRHSACGSVASEPWYSNQQAKRGLRDMEALPCRAAAVEGRQRCDRGTSARQGCICCGGWGRGDAMIRGPLCLGPCCDEQELAAVRCTHVPGHQSCHKAEVCLDFAGCSCADVALGQRQVRHHGRCKILHQPTDGSEQPHSMLIDALPAVCRTSIDRVRVPELCMRHTPELAVSLASQVRARVHGPAAMHSMATPAAGEPAIAGRAPAK